MNVLTIPLLILTPLFIAGCGTSRLIPLEAGSFRNPRLADAARTWSSFKRRTPDARPK